MFINKASFDFVLIPSLDLHFSLQTFSINEFYIVNGQARTQIEKLR